MDGLWEYWNSLTTYFTVCKHIWQSYVVYYQSVHGTALWTLICMFVVNHKNTILCRRWPPLLMDIGPPCATWCITKVGDALCRLMVHNIVLYPQSGAQHMSHKPAHTHRQMGPILLPPPLTQEVKIILCFLILGHYCMLTLYIYKEYIY